MKLGLEDKFALVTGGGRGIGRGIALCLAGEGARVCVVSRTATDVENVLEAMGGRSRGHRSLSMDLMPDGAPHRLICELAGDGFESLDIVVHNLGGTMGITDPFCSMEDWRRIYRFNFEIVVKLHRHVVPKMPAKEWGRIVHISSIASMENQGPVTYSAVKAALTAYTRSFGGAVSPDGVVVSAVLPGAVFTEGGYWDIKSRENSKHVEKFLSERQRIGRFGGVDEIGSYVTFLCSELASFNTGSIVPIDGGQGRGFFGQ